VPDVFATAALAVSVFAVLLVFAASSLVAGAVPGALGTPEPGDPGREKALSVRL
jgi:hypothetical protein